MASDDQQAPTVLVWFEDSPEGRHVLAQASGLARLRDACLTVVAVAPHERVIGCGRCLQGTVLWNIEMKKIAREELLEARAALAGVAVDVSYELLVGDPAATIIAAAERLGADIVVLPALKVSRLGPPNRRNVSAKVAAGGAWQVIVVGPGGPGGQGGEHVSPSALTGAG